MSEKFLTQRFMSRETEYILDKVFNMFIENATAKIAQLFPTPSQNNILKSQIEESNSESKIVVKVHHLQVGLT